jgi:hypothetical protein
LCTELGKLSEVSGLNTVLISVENWWYNYCLFVLLMSGLVRDVAELEEVSFWKSEKILPTCVLLVCKQVEWYTAKCVGQLVEVKSQGWNVWTF